MLDRDLSTMADVDDDARFALRENADLTAFLFGLELELIMLLLVDEKRFIVYVRTDLNDRRFFDILKCFFNVEVDFMFLLVFPTLLFPD